LPATHYLEINYEDIVDDIETQARKMLDFVGLDWEPDCLAYCGNAGAIRTASVNQVRNPIYAHAVGRWKAHEVHLKPLLTALSATIPVPGADTR
jgi:hypothetical protein